MTSREVLAYAVVGVPALAAALAVLVPRRFVTVLAVGAAVTTGILAIVMTVMTVRAAAAPLVGDWLVVDVAGALLVGVIGVVGLASVLVSPAYLATTDGSLVSPERRSTTYFALLFTFWAILLAVPLAGNLGAAWLLVEATTAASALLVGFSGKPRALEAGWKYLVLTSLGLGVALLGIVLLAAGVPGGGLGALVVARAVVLLRGQRQRARRLPALACGAGREDRLGAGAQLAARCTLGGSAAGLGAALRRAAAGRVARRLAIGALARARRRRAGRAGRPDSPSGSRRSPSPSRSSGSRWRGSACSRTRASSTWA